MKRLIEIFFQRYKIYSGILVILVLFVLSYLIYINRDNKVRASDDVFGETINLSEKEVSNIDITEKIKVDVKGSVVNPGVYELDYGSRVIDAINFAGGILEDANTSSLNLSKILKDENVIVVSSVNNEPEKEIVIEYIVEECECPELNNACVTEDNIVNHQIDSNNSEDDISTDVSKVSINSATSDQLQTLSGIGESKALAIIKYREENGNFKTIEEIMNVSGIGESLFEKIKDYITI